MLAANRSLSNCTWEIKDIGWRSASYVVQLPSLKFANGLTNRRINVQAPVFQRCLYVCPLVCIHVCHSVSNKTFVLPNTDNQTEINMKQCVKFWITWKQRILCIWNDNHWRFTFYNSLIIHRVEIGLQLTSHWTIWPPFRKLRRQTHFPECKYHNWDFYWEILLKVVPKGPFDNKSALVR